MSKWISVKDRLPPNDEYGDTFLVMLAKDNPVEWTHTRPVTAEFGLHITHIGWTVFDSWAHVNTDMDGFVTHWMPLPDAPKVEA